MDTPAGTTAPIDREALRARYRAERDKRLRPDGNDQYVQPTGRFAHLPGRSLRAADRSARPAPTT